MNAFTMPLQARKDNDIILTGVDDEDFMRMSSYDRTAKRFIVLVARRDVDEDPQDLTVSIPATIQKGERYNRNEQFVGEGFAEGEEVRVRWITEDVEPKTGYRKNNVSGESSLVVVTEGQLTFNIPESRRLTSVVFESVKP
jgi:hypothetical protein